MMLDVLSFRLTQKSHQKSDNENISDDDNMISHQIGLNIPLGANSSYVENGAVLLLPRVVLDRVTIHPQGFSRSSVWCPTLGLNHPARRASYL